MSFTVCRLPELDFRRQKIDELIHWSRDSPGYDTAILGAFDPECNLIGYLDNAPIGQWVDFNSELPQVLVTFVEGINSVYFKYAGTTYGNEYSEVITWEEDDLQYGNLAYEVAPFYCF